MIKFFAHLNTITRHRHKVMRLCFKLGLYRQGLTHDLSKYSPAEFIPGVKYFQGNRSPQAREREIFGYSAAWLHHKGRNKHHFEYWAEASCSAFIFIRMPAKYFGEMVCDRIAASKIYMGDNYDDGKPLEYFNKNTHLDGMNEQTRRDLQYFLTMLSEHGEDYMFCRLRQFIRERMREEREAKKLNKGK